MSGFALCCRLVMAELKRRFRLRRVQDSSRCAPCSFSHWSYPKPCTASPCAGFKSLRSLFLFALVVPKTLHGFAVCRIQVAALPVPFRIGRTQNPARLRRVGLITWMLRQASLPRTN
jgi:hypothetical protein